MVESKGEKLVLWGDLMHVAAVQFPEPAVTIQFDTDSKAAAVAAQEGLRRCREAGLLGGRGARRVSRHRALRADGNGYAWIPVNYMSLR